MQSVFEPRKPPNKKLLNAIERGRIPGVSAEDTPLLFENARTFDKDVRWNEPLNDSSSLPETAARLDDSASALPDPAQTIAAARSENVGESAPETDPREATIQETMREMEERSEQNVERRRLSAEAGTSEGDTEKPKRKRRGRSGKIAGELSTGGGATAEVTGTENAQEKAKPGMSLASLVRMSASTAVGDAVLAPIVAAVNSNLIQTLDAHVRSAPPGTEHVHTDAGSAVHTEAEQILDTHATLGSVQPGAEHIHTTAETLEQPVDEETRAAMLEAAILKFGPEWGHLSVPKKGKQQFRIPAFRRTLRMLKSNRGTGPLHKCGVLEVHPAILEKLSQESAALADRFPRYMPMVVPPRPWTR